jgi:Flp pilus assembly protein TadB
MSKERAHRRAERELLAERRLAAQQQARQRESARQRRRQLRRRLLGRRISDRRSVASARAKERRAVIASTLLVVLVLTYLMTRSIGMVIGVLLVAAVATPALVAVLSNRSK